MIYVVLKKSQFYNFADHKTFSAESNTSDDLLKI